MGLPFPCEGWKTRLGNLNFQMPLVHRSQSMYNLVEHLSSEVSEEGGQSLFSDSTVLTKQREKLVPQKGVPLCVHHSNPAVLEPGVKKARCPEPLMWPLSHKIVLPSSQVRLQVS